MADPGRREQKREETRRALKRAAQRLFSKQGFDRTTVEEIAVAAGVSRRTFFHYFASKEDVVLSWHGDFERVLLTAIRSAPPEQSILVVAQAAVVAAMDQFDAEEAAVLTQLQREAPALRDRDQGKYERLERAIAEALAERSGAAAADLKIRLDAMLITGVLRVCSSGWVEAADGLSIDAYVRKGFSALDQSLEPGFAGASTAGRKGSARHRR